MTVVVEQRTVEVVQIYKNLPAGHTTALLIGNEWHPHFRLGESVVLNGVDVEPFEGRHYGLVREDGQTVVVQPDFVSGEMIRVRLNMADGVRPVRVRSVPRDVWRLVCRGRVVGVLWPPSLDGGAL